VLRHHMRGAFAAGRVQHTTGCSLARARKVCIYRSVRAAIYSDNPLSVLALRCPGCNADLDDDYVESILDVPLFETLLHQRARVHEVRTSTNRLSDNDVRGSPSCGRHFRPGIGCAAGSAAARLLPKRHPPTLKGTTTTTTTTTSLAPMEHLRSLQKQPFALIVTPKCACAAACRPTLVPAPKTSKWLGATAEHAATRQPRTLRTCTDGAARSREDAADASRADSTSLAHQTGRTLCRSSGTWSLRTSAQQLSSWCARVSVHCVTSPSRKMAAVCT
jgi:hypothetical protein